MHAADGGKDIARRAAELCGDALIGGIFVSQSAVATTQRSAVQLSSNYSMLKLILLSPITLGIYPLVILSRISSDINTIASSHDGRRTMHYCLLFFLVGPITGGIANLVWNHRICNRMGTELSRRGLPYKISASTFWLWGILGSLIIVGPLVFLSKFYKAMNFLASDYNTYG